MSAPIRRFFHGSLAVHSKRCNAELDAYLGLCSPPLCSPDNRKHRTRAAGSTKSLVGRSVVGPSSDFFFAPLHTTLFGLFQETRNVDLTPFMPHGTNSEIPVQDKRAVEEIRPDAEDAEDGDLPRLSLATLVADALSTTPEHKRSSTPLKGEWVVAHKDRATTPNDSNDSNENSNENQNSHDKYLKGRALVLVTIGFLFADFVATLDQSMVATALPKLASEFNALDQLTWVVSAFFLTEAGSILTLGQILTIAPSKWVFTACFVLFKIASLICALAPALNVLIFGRTLQGIAVAGGFISVVTMISQVARIEVRALVFGSFAAVNAVASVAGPMLGGILTDKLSWRWTFYINLPISAVSLLVILIFMPVHEPLPNASLAGKPLIWQWLCLDWVGAVLSLGTTICFVLPLQWANVSRPWNDPVVIALFCTSGVLLALFLLWERRMGERALLPLHLLSRRTQLAGGISAFFIMMSFIVSVYYLPFYYQAKGNTASQAGIAILPYMMATVGGMLMGGFIAGRTGRFWYSWILGPMLAAIGAGLAFTIKYDTPNSHVIGFQIILGLGIGIAYQMPLIAMQAEYANEPELTPQAMSLLLFFQLLGGVFGIAIAGTVFGNRLDAVLQDSLATGRLSPQVLHQVKQSVNVIFELPEDVQRLVVTAYVASLDYAFIVIVPACGLASFFALFAENLNLKEDSKPNSQTGDLDEKKEASEKV
ncbi:hypothetical protein M408DRAFT_328401 [Serendipita vermifera MAFF 305830]|uniref:Major facilitator superfamily (MFS) profile domain-containing protein n=1 Tax=Serendipita vermifera MAFF 305830 TaxID=933852 RepID=A0A0C3BES1_SERVB|nr:hypothetical protein M408DRAFT_328401 [Serendipita vermifera MAFF 305830]